MSMYPTHPKPMTRKQLYEAIAAMTKLPDYMLVGHYADTPNNHMWKCEKHHDVASFFSTGERAMFDAKAHVVLFH